jgi:hypothetical protein
LLAVVILAVAMGCRQNAPVSDPVAAPYFSPEGGSYEDALDVILRTETDGAGIRYTIDGSTPSAIHGRVYDGFPLSVHSSVMIRAIAWMPGRQDSPVSAVTYALAGTAETPVFSPDAGTGPFDTGQLVTMSTGTPGAWIWYTTDGSDPRPEDGYGAPYLGVPVPIDATTTLKAAAWKPGVAQSMAAEALYVIRRPTAIDWEGDVGQYSCIARADGASPVDPDVLLIAYRDASNSALKLARSTDGGLAWSTSFLDWQGDVGCHASIAASGSLAAVAYRVTGAADLRCAVSTDSGATWHRYPVIGAGADCQYTSTAIRGSAEIYIAYYEAVSTDLKLAYSTDSGTTWTVRGLETSTGNVGQYAAVALNGTRVFAGYYDATGGDLRFGRAATPADTFTSAKVDSSGNVGQYCSLRWDAASSTVWLAYHDVTNGALKIAYSPVTDANWQPSITIDSDGVTGLYASLAVSGSSGQNLAVAYYEDWEYRLKVARSTDTGASWTTEVVDEGGVGQWASIVETDTGYAVSYYDSLAGDLRLAVWDGTGWTLH